MPSLTTLRDSGHIKKQVDDRTREITSLQETSGRDNSSKIKFKHGGPVVVIRKNKVAWPHEVLMLGGVNGHVLTMINYPSLNGCRGSVETYSMTVTHLGVSK